MTKDRMDGLTFLLLGALIFLLLGAALVQMPGTLGDFRMQYYPARCLLGHGDPYNEADVLRTYRAEAGPQPGESVGARLMTTEYIYLPTAFTVTLPLACLGYGPAHWIWLAASSVLLILAGLAIWDLGAGFAPVLSGFLVGFLLANSELVLTNGNVAGIAIALAAISVWCLYRNRFVGLGILSLALALDLKPHDSWLIWLFFLLAGPTHRKRAIAVLLVAAALSLPYVLWLYHLSPRWTNELRANMTTLALHGGTDASRNFSSGSGSSMIIDLQAAISFFTANPHLYNLASYVVFGALLLPWGWLVFRGERSGRAQLLALSVIAPLTMLPVYHRECDAKLLLLTIPACAMLFSEGRRTARIAVAISLIALVATADIPWAIDIAAVRALTLRPGFTSNLLAASQTIPVPAILLAESIFFLWIFKLQTDRSRG